MTLLETRIGAWLPGIALSGLLAVGCSQTVDEAQTDEGLPETVPEVSMTAPPQTPDAPDAEAPAEVAATVNGHPIMMSEVRAIFNERVAPYAQQIPPDQVETFWQMQMPVMLDMAIGQYLIRSEIESRGITADEEAIDARLAEIEQDIPDGQTLEQLTGQSREELRPFVAEMLAFEQLLDIYDLNAAEPTDDEIAAYYEENQEEFAMPESVQARHILLTVEEDADDETREAKLAEINDIRQQLLDGADFAELATAHSDCPSSQRGGDLGSFGRDQMVPAFEAAAFSQEPGEIGSVVETPFGYHIIQVIETQDAREVSLDEVREHIAERLLNEARQESQTTLINKLKADAEIEHFAP